MTRALVLGGGGLTGIAWEAGVLQGLAEAGEDLGHWEMVVGTSAGAYIGARLLAEGSPRSAFEAQLDLDVGAMERRLSAVTGRTVVGLVRLARRPGARRVQSGGIAVVALRALAGTMALNGIGEVRSVAGAIRSRGTSDGPDGGVRAMGRLARGIRGPEEPWISWWADALGPVDDWPDARLVVTALGIDDGMRVAIERGDGVPIARAIAASTALAGLLPPIEIAGVRCMDGGTGSPTNADLATDADDVLVVAPVDRGRLAGEVAGLQRAGGRVRLIRPGPESLATLGRDLGRLDPERVAASAVAGREDGRRAAAVAATLAVRSD